MKEQEIRTVVSEYLRDQIIKDTLNNRYILAGGYSFDSLVDGLVKKLILPCVVNSDSDVCPDKKDCKIIMFTADEDICQKCNKTFEGK